MENFLRSSERTALLTVKIRKKEGHCIDTMEATVLVISMESENSMQTQAKGEEYWSGLQGAIDVEQRHAGKINQIYYSIIFNNFQPE